MIQKIPPLSKVNGLSGVFPPFFAAGDGDS